MAWARKCRSACPNVLWRCAKSNTIKTLLSWMILCAVERGQKHSKHVSNNNFQVKCALTMWCVICAKTASVCKFNWRDATIMLIKRIEYFSSAECVSTYSCFVSSEHVWMYRSTLSRSCHQQDASCCMSQWRPSSTASIKFPASDVRPLGHAAMFRKHVCVDFDIATFKVEVVFFSNHGNFCSNKAVISQIEMKTRKKSL